MNSERTSSAGLLLLAGGLILAVVGLGLRSSDRMMPVDLSRPSEQAHVRIEQALAAQARALEPKAVAAGRVFELQAALDMGADRATCQDLFDNEEWWGPYRSAFTMSALIADAPLASVGPAANGLAEAEMIRRARERGVASGLLPGNGRAFIAAAASVSLNKRPGIAPVVVLGKTLDSSVLKAVSASTGDAVGLSDGTKLLEAGGPSDQGREMAPLIGREAGGPSLLGDGRMGAAWPLGDSLWLVGAFSAPPLPRQRESRPLWFLAAGVVLAALGAVALVLRRGPKGDIPAPTLLPIPRPQPSHWPESSGTSSVHHIDSARSLPIPSAPHRGADLRGRAAAVGQAPSYVANPAPLPPSRMGRYELIERIGEGGMAEIFFAAARGAENFVRYFVVKRMHPQLAHNQEAVNQFIDEGRLQAGLVHSNIVPVFDFGKAEGEYFLALEYIHGKDLGQIVQRHADQFGRPLDVGIACYIVHDVLEALSYAHSQLDKDGTPMEIVHRDVSPGNVLVSYRGEIKLTDFGIAKADRRVSRTELGMVKGNASFMSPEQARGEAVDIRSDVFSAGLVLFFCLTNQFLYRGETTLNRLLRAAVGPATSQFDQIDQLPLPAAKVLRRALALDPDVRYGSAAEFARDLTPHIASRTDLTHVMDLLFPTSLRRDLR